MRKFIRLSSIISLFVVIFISALTSCSSDNQSAKAEVSTVLSSALSETTSSSFMSTENGVKVPAENITFSDGTTSSNINSYTDAIQTINNMEKKPLILVNDEPIYNIDLLKDKAAVDLSIDKYLVQNKEILTSQEVDSAISKYNLSDDELLKRLIKAKVIQQTAIRLELTFDNDAVYEQAKFEFCSMKDDSLSLYFYEKLLWSHNMNEEQYIEEVYVPAVKSRLLPDKLFQNFVASNDFTDAQKNNREYINSEYEKYIDGLIKKAKIEYVK